jgi:hypothetical protein
MRQGSSTGPSNTQTPAGLSHVFVCYGAHSFDAALRIAEQLLQPSERRFFFLLFPADTTRLPAGTHYSMVPPLLLENNFTKPFVIARWFSSALKKFNEHDSSEIIAYIPHPFELPGNHFMFHEPRVKRLELLPDGLMNYLDRPVIPESARKKAGYLARSGLRALAAKATGFRYRPLTHGHLTQFRTGRYERSWTFNPQGYLTLSGELARLPERRTPSPRSTAQQGGLLILDQEISHIVSAELEESVRAKLYELVGSQKAGAVFYKAHPRGNNRAHEWRAEGIPVSDLSASGQAEDLLFEHGISSLFSFFSTPLLLSAEAVQTRFAVLPVADAPGVRQKKLVAELRDVLRASGAHVIAP